MPSLAEPGPDPGEVTVGSYPTRWLADRCERDHIRGAGRVPRSTQIHPATLDELAVITEAMPEELRLAVQLGAWCALRYGEVFELRRKDLDTIHGVVHVRRGVVWTKAWSPTTGRKPALAYGT